MLTIRWGVMRGYNKEKFKSDGWPYLIKYINDRVESETDAKKR